MKYRAYYIDSAVPFFYDPRIECNMYKLNVSGFV